jgi:hypothetical protein
MAADTRCHFSCQPRRHRGAALGYTSYVNITSTSLTNDIRAGLLLTLLALSTACSKSVPLKPTQLAGKGKGQVKVELTYDRNNRLDLKLSDLPAPSSLKPEFTRYVLWVANPDRSQPVNTGQLRVDDKAVAKIQTLTPRRRYILFVTAEVSGDTLAPSGEIIFESPVIEW